MQIDALIDAFVRSVNAASRELEELENVPEYLRDGEAEDGMTRWKIAKSDNSTSVEVLERRIRKRFPPSFRYLIANYSFPAFELGAILFFANTGQNTFWELSRRLFLDPHLTPVRLDMGFIQIGNPQFYNYDPVCFDTNGPSAEYGLVQLDHEEILISQRVKVVREIAPSFVEFVKAH